MLYNMDGVAEELKLALTQFPSHFDVGEQAETKQKLKDLEWPLTASVIRRILDRIKDGESEYLHDSQFNLREHFKCRDLNLTLFMEYQMSMLSAPGTAQQMKVVRKMTQVSQEYPNNMIALSNLANLKLQQQQVDEAQMCLEKLEVLGPWERVLADAEMAYTYRRIGPRGHLYVKTLSEKVVNLRGYSGLTEGVQPEWLGELKIEYSYEAALAIQRLFNSSCCSDSFRHARNDPEELMKQSALLLKNVVFSGLSIYETTGMLMLSETFKLYKWTAPKDQRTLKISDFEWPGLKTVDQCLEKAVEAVETAGLANVSFRALHMLGNQFRTIKRGPKYDLDKAERYLKQAAELSNKPAIQHHLALVYRGKWLNGKDASEKGSCNANIRDPGHPLLKKAITHLEKADEYSHGTGVLFRVELARLKFSYSEEPIPEESRDAIMDILNGCILYTHLGLTSRSIQSYLFHELALMHKELFNDWNKYRKYLELSVGKASQAKTYSPALLDLKKLVKEESRTESERYKNLGKMYTICERHSNARWNLERAMRLNPNDPNILEDLVVSLIGLDEFQAARQCLIILRDIDHAYLEKDPNRDRYIRVSLRVAQQFSAGIAASIYQELMRDIRPKTAEENIVVISSEESSDTVRTKAVVDMIRHGLGFTEDNCILPMEAIWKFYGQDTTRHTSSHVEFFVKNAWCIVVHLTDTMLDLDALLFDVNNSIEDVRQRKGHVVIVDDVRKQNDMDWKQSTGNMRRCQPWISYSELFHLNLEVVGPERPNASDEVLQDEQALELVEDCAAVLQDLHVTGPPSSTAPDGRGVPHTGQRQSTGAEGSQAREESESTSRDEREVPFPEQGDNNATERREVSSNTQSGRIVEEGRAVSANEQGASTAAKEESDCDQSNSFAAEGTDGGQSATEATEATRGGDAPDIQSWTPSALERLFRAMLSANE